MFPFTGIVGRIAVAVLAGVVAFIIVFVLGAITIHYEAVIGAKLEEFAPIVGLLVGIVYFFARPTPPSL